MLPSCSPIKEPAIGPFLYLGAKHMLTGYDHIMFLIGVIFFLYRLKDIVTYVSLFTLGHSTISPLGVFTGVHANSFLIDAVIALSVVYKAFRQYGRKPSSKFLGFEPNTKSRRIDLRSVSRIWSRDQTPGTSPVQNRPHHQHHQLQRWGRDRTSAGAIRRSDFAHLLARPRRLLPSRLRGQHSLDDRRIHLIELPAHRISNAMTPTMTKEHQTEVAVYEALRSNKS